MKIVFWTVMIIAGLTAYAESLDKTTPVIPVYVEIDVDEQHCLAQNIYFEAGNQSLEGMAAVADVTLNRVQNSRYPNTICDVVKQGLKHPNGMMKRNMCQFSWYCDGRVDTPNEGRTWRSAQELAKKVLVNHYDKALIDITDGATHYHANWMEKYPKWSKKKKIMASIDRHIFYGSRKTL